MPKKMHIFGLVLAIFFAEKSAAIGMDCVKGSSPGKEYKGSRTNLPELKNRKILGVWKHVDFASINVSLELVNGSVYYVMRDRYCNSGKIGEKLQKKGSRFYSSDNSAGDFHEILSDGTLGRFDNQGLIDKLPTSPSLYPQ